MLGLSMETPVSPSAPQAQWTNTYRAVITQMLSKADEIGDMLYSATNQTMPNIIQELHNLVQYGRHFSFYASVKYAAMRGDESLIETVFRHPLLKVVYMYLATVDSGDRIYLDWTIEAIEQKPKFFSRKRTVIYRVNYKLTHSNPYDGFTSAVSTSERGDMIPVPASVTETKPKKARKKLSIKQESAEEIPDLEQK